MTVNANVTAHRSALDRRTLSPVLRRHLDALRPPTPAEERAAVLAIRDARLAAWAAVLSDPARSPAAVRTGVQEKALEPIASALPYIMWRRACDDAARSRPRSPQRAAVPAAAKLLATSMAKVDMTDDALRATVAALSAFRNRYDDPSPDAAHARAALADLDAKVKSLVARNLRLVASQAHAKMRTEDGTHDLSGMTCDDVFAFGVSGLERGIRGFDADAGWRLSTYAVPWIRQAISRAVGDLGRVIRLPIHMLETARKVRRIVREYAAAFPGQEPTAEQVAAVVRKPMATVEMVMKGGLPRTSTSLDTWGGPGGWAGLGSRDEDDDTGGLVARIASDDLNPEEAMMAAEEAEQAHRVMRVLDDPRERQVIRRRFGFGRRTRDDGDPLHDIGNDLGVSKERVRQIEAKALAKMREYASAMTG